MWILYLTGFLAFVQLQQSAAFEVNSRIIGGQTVSVADYPYLVNLQRGNRMRCGGQLISPSCVLTAAHCLEGNLQVSNLFVHAQQQCLSDTSSPPHVRQAWYALLPPSYGRLGLDSDLAIIKLRQPFDISSNASTIALDYNELPADANLTVLGWGTTRRKCCNWNQCLHGTHVSLLKRFECLDRLHHFSHFTDNMFCALGKKNRDVCLGDGGGPVVHAGRLVGVVSWDKGCGSGIPSVYTRISSLEMTVFLKSRIATHC
ncbi:trypsin-4 [Drosophila nasuta]|uniref:trypsin-4 n=1 Tax=Drosophila nasuta TaxID=42062 RepID=UPI00295F1375|nr:trypsin-4 [Drosophila nasuta]